MERESQGGRGFPSRREMADAIDKYRRSAEAESHPAGRERAPAGGWKTGFEHVTTGIIVASPSPERG